MELRVATETEKIERDQVTFAEWGTRLSLEQYLVREKVLREHAFSKGMTTWLWCDGPQVLSSCETYENVSCVAGVQGVTWSFASVFTEPHLRRHGHATKLMDAVVARLQQRPNAQACVLFSDVGARLYERSGFIAAPGKDLVLPALPGDPEKGVTPLTEVQPHAYHGDGLVLRPTVDQLDWAVTREGLYANFLKQQRPSFRGAFTNDACAYWAAYYKSSELIVLWLEGNNDVEAVLRSAQRQAHRCGLERVRLWAPEPLNIPRSGTLIEREGELPMYRPYVPVTRWLHIQRALWV